MDNLGSKLALKQIKQERMKRERENEKKEEKKRGSRKILTVYYQTYSVGAQSTHISESSRRPKAY